MSADVAPGSSRLGAGRRGREAADSFRLMADSAAVMIWVADPEGQGVYFNRPWLDFSGRPLASELGLGWAESLHPEERESTLAAYRAAFAAREPFELEHRLRRHDGEHRWLLVRGVPLSTEERLQGFVGSCLDITDRMAAEQAARKREHDFKTLAENIPDVIARLDRQLRCLYVNRAIEQTFGIPAAQLIGRRGVEVPLPSSLSIPLANAVRRAFATGAQQEFEFTAMANAERRHFSGRVVAEAAAGGSVDAVLVIVHDVTARAREDERRAEALARERSARENAESATLARDHFLSIVSHELRTPLNGIKTWAHYLENQLPDADPAIRRAIAGVMIGVDQQVRLIDDLLDLTRALGGTLAIAKHPVALLPLLASVVEDARSRAVERGLRLEASFALGDAEVAGDDERLRQVFASLLGNALKFTQAGGAIHVAATVDDDMACVEVRDDGPGIAAEFLPFVFDPFRQADQRSSRRLQHGMGLGLPLVQRLAQLHGGHATCESAGAGKGSTFRVYLPLRAETSGDALSAASAATAEQHLPSLAGVRVLLIDDQREARESLAALLAQAGALVSAAESGSEAMRLLESGAEAELPEVIVCDIAMPGEDGYATLRRIRAWEGRRKGTARRIRPAVAVSAHGGHEDRLRALREGFQMHLTKPVAPAELMLVISNAARALRA
jgi:PAS domain S-box-containing protein